MGLGDRISMTPGELAFSLKLNVGVVKQAAGVRSSYSKLSGKGLCNALERLAEELEFDRLGWDLSELNDFQGDWVSALKFLYSTPVAFPASLPPSQGKQIRDLILKESPKRLLEIGSFIGISSHWIASALEDLGDGVLDSVDTFWSKYPNRYHFSFLEDSYGHALNALNISGLSHRINYHLNDSVAFSKRLSVLERFDFMFIDGDHTFPGMARDFISYYPHLKPGGIILLHDTNPAHCGWDGPRRFIDLVLKENPQVAVEEIETEPNYGMALIRKLDDSDLKISFRNRLILSFSMIGYEGRKAVTQNRVSQLFLNKFVKTMISYSY